ncbi:MAG: protein kinase domain-containing protein [Gemmatimonadales bacterium]
MAEQLGHLTAALTDRYRLEHELGQGGMATVYLAHDLRHDRKVALKVLRPELSAILGAARFLGEIKTTANLQHPHILSLFDSGEADGLVFYVMPYVEGESLRARLLREKQLPVDEAVRIAREVADALDYAHRHGVIHRDIKPENILLHDGRALVADFGIALAAARSEGGARMTETGMSLGTPAYMSPEQAMGEREITARSDVYALGCVLYEMLTGEPPFTGPTAQAIIARVMTEEPRSLTMQRKTVPPHVEAAVVTALSKLPADRFASAAQFGEALARPGATTVVLPASRGAAAAAHKPGFRARATAAVPWVLALLAIAGAAWAWREQTSRGSTTWRYIAFGPELTTATTRLPLALSPDGSALAIVDNTPNGRIWLKRRGALRPTPIPGTENGAFPTFSPDGQWLAFLDGPRLKKVRLGEGGAVTLVDSVDQVQGGVAWLDDNTLIYPGPGLQGLALFRISADGGASTLVLKDKSLAGFGTGFPYGLPGARGVLFTVCSSGCAGLSLQALDLRTGHHSVLLNDAAGGILLPGNLLLYVRRDGTALVAPFDLDKLVLTAPGVPVLEGVSVTNGAARLTASRTGMLVYEQGASSNDVQPVRVSRDGVVSPIDTAWHGAFNSFAVSPDGRRLAVGVGLEVGKQDIWIKQLDRGTFTRLTFGGMNRRPAWSPDGRTVAFIHDTGRTSVVYERPVDGSLPQGPLARLDRQVQEVAWSPDGRWLLLRTDNGAAGAGDIVGVRTSGDTTPVPLVADQFSEIHPTVSPDGHWIAYTSDESGTQEVYVRAFPGTTAGRWQVSNGGGFQPRWSSDGRELYFGSGDRLMAAELRTGHEFEVTRLRTVLSSAGFPSDRFHQTYDVLPGGQGVVFPRPWQTGPGAAAPTVVEVENWLADVRARTRK